MEIRYSKWKVHHRIGERGADAEGGGEGAPAGPRAEAGAGGLGEDREEEAEQERRRPGEQRGEGSSPEGGADGGEIIASGTPEDLVKIKLSHTGKHLKKELKP